MKRILGLTVALALLAGCGADGEPERPTADDSSKIYATDTTGTVGVVE